MPTSVLAAIEALTFSFKDVIGVEISKDHYTGELIISPRKHLQGKPRGIDLYSLMLWRFKQTDPKIKVTLSYRVN